MAVFTEFRNLAFVVAAILAAGAVVAALIVFLVGRFGKTYVHSRGLRVVNCPETGQTVAVKLNAMHAALTGTFGRPDLELTSCTRWPEKQDCGQMCVRQIEWSPDGCLIRARLEAFYDGKKCVYCGAAIHPREWLEHKPAMRVDGRILNWTDIPAEQIPATLLKAEPVCFSCAITETFRKEHPDLVIERNRES
jgi:hypothetical protein